MRKTHINDSIFYTDRSKHSILKRKLTFNNCIQLPYICKTYHPNFTNVEKVCYRVSTLKTDRAIIRPRPTNSTTVSGKIRTPHATLICRHSTTLYNCVSKTRPDLLPGRGTGLLLYGIKTSTSIFFYVTVISRIGKGLL